MALKRNIQGAVGKSQARLDGREKVSGESLFTEDFYLPRMLYGKILRSTQAHAKIVKIDTSEAEKVPGIKAVITAKDCEGVAVGKFQGVFADGVVRHVGEEVAAVAAIDDETALRAVRLIKVEYEPLPPVFDIRKATREGAPLLHPQTDSNVALEMSEENGDPDQTFADCAHVREDIYWSNPSHNLFSEFHAAVADFVPGGKLTVWTPSQSAYMYQNALAKSFDMPESDVRIMCLNTGGAFTGRSAVRPHHYIAAILSRKAARPVKIAITGDEEFLVSRAGGQNRYRFKTGVDAQGHIKAIELEIDMSCGSHIESQFVAIMLPMSYIHLQFPVEHTRYDGRLIYTNNIPYYFHHGGGLAQLQFAYGQHVDQLALDINMDPVEFLLKNSVEPNHTTVNGVHFKSCGLKECITKASVAAGWSDKFGKLPPYRGIGIGIGAMASGGARGPMGRDTSNAFLKLSEDGKITVITGLPDMGQSSHTAMAIIAAEALGVEAEDVTVVSGDTDVTPYDVGAFSQRGTFMTGNAVLAAANTAKQKISDFLSTQWEVSPDEIVYQDRTVFPASEPSKGMPLKEALKQIVIQGDGNYVMAEGSFASDPGQKGAKAYSFGAQVVEVEVDPDTGEVAVLNVVHAHDVGRALNPKVVEGQIDGQFFSGMSQVLYEECLMDEGQVLNPTRLEYKMPRSYEMPEIEHIIVETIDPLGPFGAKEVGEGPIVCTMHTIANAVANAIGVRVMEMPMTPARIMRGIKQARKADAA